MGEKIDVLEHAGEILPAVNKGVLLTSAANGKANTMTISWGMLGVEWARPVFVTFVREGRFTRTLLDETGEFTIGIPGRGSTARFWVARVASPAAISTRLPSLGCTR